MSGQFGLLLDVTAGPAPAPLPVEAVIVIDRSGSMGDPEPRQPGALQIIKAYLQSMISTTSARRAISAAKSAAAADVSLCLVAFDHRVEVIHSFSRLGGPGDKHIISKIHALKADGYTDIKGALTRALEQFPIRPDNRSCTRLVLLLTDGVPWGRGVETDERKITESFKADIQRLGAQGVVLHTFGMANHSASLLASLSEVTHGQYRYVHAASSAADCLALAQSSLENVSVNKLEAWVECGDNVQLAIASDSGEGLRRELLHLEHGHAHQLSFGPFRLQEPHREGRITVQLRADGKSFCVPVHVPVHNNMPVHMPLELAQLRSNFVKLLKQCAGEMLEAGQLKFDLHVVRQRCQQRMQELQQRIADICTAVPPASSEVALLGKMREQLSVCLGALHVKDFNPAGFGPLIDIARAHELRSASSLVQGVFETDEQKAFKSLLERQKNFSGASLTAEQQSSNNAMAAIAAAAAAKRNRQA